MSRLAVRQALQGELETMLAAEVPPVTFVPSINENARPPKADIWVSIEFQSDYLEKLCYSGSFQIEHGTAFVSIFGKGGSGYDAVITLADKIQDHFNAFYGTDVEVTETNSANEITAGDARGDYGVEVELNYSYSFKP